MHSTNLINTSNALSAGKEQATFAMSQKFPWWKIFTFGSMGRYLLTIAIIAIRAFQTNAQPMSTWSAASWVAMTIPVWLPTTLGALLFVLWFVLWVWANASRRY